MSEQIRKLLEASLDALLIAETMLELHELTAADAYPLIQKAIADLRKELASEPG